MSIKKHLDNLGMFYEKEACESQETLDINFQVLISSMENFLNEYKKHSKKVNNIIDFESVLENLDAQ